MLEVDVLIQNRLWNISVNRLYYACYYAVSALLLHIDVHTKTHAGARQMFGLHFVDTGIVSREAGHYYKKIFSMRHKGDYEDYFDNDEEDVIALREPAQNLINEVLTILSK